MFERDKNHACIIAWSTGNEAGNGPAHHRAYMYLKRRDTTRPVQYENARSEPLWSQEEVETLDANSDIYAPMYPSHAKLLRYARKFELRPDGEWRNNTNANTKPTVTMQNMRTLASRNLSLKFTTSPRQRASTHRPPPLNYPPTLLSPTTQSTPDDHVRVCSRDGQLVRFFPRVLGSHSKVRGATGRGPKFHAPNSKFCWHGVTFL